MTFILMQQMQQIQQIFAQLNNFRRTFLNNEQTSLYITHLYIQDTYYIYTCMYVVQVIVMCLQVTKREGGG